MEPSSIPKQYGGELDWAWGDMPNLDEPSRELLRGIEQPLAEGQTRKNILKGPILFNGDHLQVLGTVDGTNRREIVPIPKTQASVESEANTPGSAERAASSSEETKVDDDEKMIDNVAVKVNQLCVDGSHVAV
jgi:hypothetical protein